MKLENILNIIIDINEKINTYEDLRKPASYYEVLHMSLSAIVLDMTEEQYKTMPLPYRMTIEKLEENILENCSKMYMQNYQECIKKQKEDIEDEIPQYYEDEEDNDGYDKDENDDNYELKWIDNPHYNSNLIL